MHVAGEDHLVVGDGHIDPARIDLRASLQRRFDLPFDVGGTDLRLDRDGVGDAPHPHEVSHGIRGGGALVLPIHVSLQRHPAIADRGRDLLVGHHGVPRERRDNRLRDLCVGPLLPVAQSHVHVIGHGLDAIDGKRRAFSRGPLGVRPDVSAQRHDATLHGDADVRGVDAWLPVERLLDMLL
jgi:hypothetical protein